MWNENRRGAYRMGWNPKVVLIALAVVVALAFLVLVLVLRNWHGSVASGGGYADDSSTLTDAGDALGASDIVLPMSQREREILNKHFAAVGGANLFISMTSFRVAGDLTTPEGQAYEVIMARKGKLHERITVRSTEDVRVSTATPADRWFGRWVNGELVEVQDLSPEQAREMQFNAAVVDELFEATQSGRLMRYLGQRDFNYKMAHVFEVQHGERESTRFFIDPESELNTGREDRAFQSDGTLRIIRRVYSDHLKAGQLTIPGKVEIYVNDALVRTLIVRQADLNAGVLDTAFQRPQLAVTP